MIVFTVLTFIFLHTHTHTHTHAYMRIWATLKTLYCVIFSDTKATASFNKKGKSPRIITTAAQVTGEHGSVWKS